MTGQINVNKIAARTGTAITVESGHKIMMPGSVIQTVYDSIITPESTSSTSYVNTSLAATITPTSSSSKILVTFEQSFFWQTNGGGSQGCGIRIYRGNSAITTNSGYSGLYLDSGNASNNRVHTYQHGQKLDAPNTTSAVTYNLYGYYWTNDWTDLRYQYDDGNTDSPSTITLMEISA